MTQRNSIRIMKSPNQLARLCYLLGLMIPLVAASSIQVVEPDLLAIKYPGGIAIRTSPVGFKPISGSLEGRLVMADPSPACHKIQDLHAMEEDIFVLADDVGCLESVKAKNIANSGAYAGLIRRNLNNTLHDKEVNLVHIPILELEPGDYDEIVKFIKAEQTVIMSVEFYDHTQSHPINI